MAGATKGVCLHLSHNEAAILCAQVLTDIQDHELAITEPIDASSLRHTEAILPYLRGVYCALTSVL